ncbi:hypothetical protein [Fictibacillus solisalsi]|uniref:hypothetical protein n=1 Tax=Fictibacillus solisalsi TaxID=459525 RepID=UPI00147FEA83|nr:hypothetical protein [Fictibacillus solisalsi]
MDNTKPKQNLIIYLKVKGLPNGSYKSVFHFKSKDTVYTGTIGKSKAVKNGRQPKGIKW